MIDVDSHEVAVGVQVDVHAIRHSRVSALNRSLNSMLGGSVSTK
jgi:hypothetical protein